MLARKFSEGLEAEKEEEEREVAKSSINSPQGLEHCGNYQKEIKEIVPDDASSSSSEFFRETLKQRENCGSVLVNNGELHLSPKRGEEIGYEDDERFEDIVQWLHKVETPPLNEKFANTSGNESEILSVDWAERFLSSIYGDTWDKEAVLSPLVKKTQNKKQINNISQAVLRVKGDEASTKVDDETQANESVPRALPLNNERLHLSDQENDGRSDLSVVSFTSTDIFLSSIYGDTWDREPVLAPLVKKTQNKKQIDSISQRDLKDISLTIRKDNTQVNKGVFKTPLPYTKNRDLDDEENILTPADHSLRFFKDPKPLQTPKTPNIPTIFQPTITLGFLQSLSVSPSAAEWNVRALYYKKNFKTKKEELTAELFAYYNTVVFDCKLPGDMKIEWSTRLNKTAGKCYYSTVWRAEGRINLARIELATKVCTSPDRVRDTLIHEMCHAAVWLLDGVKDDHGPLWRTWACKAMKKLPELPPIRRCHRYKIETKYIYRCISCGYSVGRHSKSLDLGQYCCGKCHSKFELLVSTKTRKGETAAGVTLRAPRDVKGFALYVKENYRVVQEETKDLKHGEIMKLLGTKFAALKIQMNN